MMKLIISIIFFVVLAKSECSRILVLFPTISKSHLIPLQTLTKSLAARGHEITFVTTFTLNKKIKNHREIKVPFDESDKEFLSEITRDPKGKGFTYMFPRLTKLIYTLGNQTLQMKEMRDLMENESFDLVIVGFFLTDFLFGVADHFKCPSILFSPAGTVALINEAMGNPLEPAAVAHMMLPVKKMDFVGRLKTFLMTGVELAFTRYLKYRSKQVYDFNFPSDRYISYDQALQNISLTLTNSHFSSGIVRPYLPNTVEIGGIQVKPTPSRMPDELQTFLDDAVDGAIFFSFGSNAKSTFLSDDVIKIILNVFAKLKQRVVMKWEADSMKDQPKNVFISKWLPQDDILAHKNTKLFISHCGLGSVIESKYHRVPIVGMPLFGDQPGNADAIVKDGWGLVVDLATMTEKSLTDAINEIMSNTKYAQVVKKLSDLARDRPMNAPDTAIFWIEYILRYHGAPHLHYPGADLNFLQRNSIDVIFCILAILYISFQGFKYTVKLICCRKKNQKDLYKKNN